MHSKASKHRCEPCSGDGWCAGAPWDGVMWCERCETFVYCLCTCHPEWVRLLGTGLPGDWLALK